MRISDWVQTCALPILRAFPLSWKRHSIIAPVREYRPMMIRPFLKRAMLRLATAFALLITGFLAAGLIGGAIPAHAGWRPPAPGITLSVERAAGRRAGTECVCTCRFRRLPDPTKKK